VKKKREERKRIMLNNQKIRDDMSRGSSQNNVFRPKLEKPGFIERGQHGGGSGSTGSMNSFYEPASNLSETNGMTAPPPPPRRESGRPMSGIHMAPNLSMSNDKRKAPPKRKVPARKIMERPVTPPTSDEDNNDDNDDSNKEEEEEEEEEETVVGGGDGDDGNSASNVNDSEDNEEFDIIRKAVAQFDYIKSEDGELTFYEEDVIVVVAEDESGWGMGYVEGGNGDRGVFPLNFISTPEEEISSSTKF
jgi:hypothetical protein